MEKLSQHEIEGKKKEPNSSQRNNMQSNAKKNVIILIN
ncbi:hypothetical protein BSA_13480 [Streptococcus agalactiae 09mas018883]|nr:hypothetical protein BSA_13480 [Streptococcus agalactiae 09mas018883]